MKKQLASIPLTPVWNHPLLKNVRYVYRPTNFYDGTTKTSNMIVRNNFDSIYNFAENMSELKPGYFGLGNTKYSGGGAGVQNWVNYGNFGSSYFGLFNSIDYTSYDSVIGRYSSGIFDVLVNTSGQLIMKRATNLTMLTSTKQIPLKTPVSIGWKMNYDPPASDNALYINGQREPGTSSYYSSVPGCIQFFANGGTTGGVEAALLLMSDKLESDQWFHELYENPFQIFSSYRPTTYSFPEYTPEPAPPATVPSIVAIKTSKTQARHQPKAYPMVDLNCKFSNIWLPTIGDTYSVRDVKGNSHASASVAIRGNSSDGVVLNRNYSGSADPISFSNNPKPSTGFTILCRVLIKNSDYYHIFGPSGSGAENGGYGLIIQGSFVLAACGSGTNNGWLNHPLSDYTLANKWFTFVLTRNVTLSSYMYIYYNNNKIASMNSVTASDYNKFIPTYLNTLGTSASYTGNNQSSLIAYAPDICMTDDECFSLCENPWQMFKTNRNTFYSIPALAVKKSAMRIRR